MAIPYLWLRVFLISSGVPSSHNSGFVSVAMANLLAVFQLGRRLPLKIKDSITELIPTVSASLY